MKNLIIIFTVIFLSGCSISTHVTPVDSNKEIQKVYVRYNDKVHMEGMNDELVWQFKNLGFDAELYNGDTPLEAVHTFTYTANWTWDMAMYLLYFRGTLYEQGRVLGEVEYDAKMGGGNLNKFGKTREKLTPLMTELLQNLNRPNLPGE